MILNKNVFNHKVNNCLTNCQTYCNNKQKSVVKLRNEPRCEQNGLGGSDTNQAVQPQKMARGLKYCIKEVEGLYYPCSKTNGADQLHIYCATDLRLCFHICKMQVFSQRGQINQHKNPLYEC